MIYHIQKHDLSCSSLKHIQAVCIIKMYQAQGNTETACDMTIDSIDVFPHWLVERKGTEIAAIE